MVWSEEPLDRAADILQALFQSFCRLEAIDSSLQDGASFLEATVVWDLAEPVAETLQNCSPMRLEAAAFHARCPAQSG